jgi:low temperature requirement protein LtrA
MVEDGQRGALFRPLVPNQHARVTYAELLFDLVFVFAVTQISHTLLGRFTPLGALQTTLLFLGVWWVWVYTSWITNWFNPELTPVRILLFLLMLGGLVLSTSIPKAFEERGLWFAAAYAAMQVGRTVFWVASTPPTRPLARMSAIRVLVWLSISAVFWIAGGFAEGELRLILWATALAIEYVSPAVRFWIPRYGASSLADWIVEGGHMAERCAGFIIIALGESIVVTGATFADLPWTLETVTAFMAAFIGALAMWWIYFHKGAEAGSEQISRSSEPGRLARLAYTYLHMPIVAGIILSAVTDELVLTHPADHSDLKTVLSAIGGPLLFLIGTILFKHTFRRFLQLSHGVGIVALCILAWFASGLSPLMLSILTTAILVVVAVW